jgi:hypothetical protein
MAARSAIGVRDTGTHDELRQHAAFSTRAHAPTAPAPQVPSVAATNDSNIFSTIFCQNRHRASALTHRKSAQNASKYHFVASLEMRACGAPS